jgi:hypothetical protein
MIDTGRELAGQSVQSTTFNILKGASSKDSREA